MNLQHSLFHGDHIWLAHMDPEKDAPVEARWTHDATYQRMLSLEPARPLSPDLVKQRYDEILKEIEKEKNMFYFTVRLRADDSLIGFARLKWISWNMGYAAVELGIGEASQRGKGYGTQALRLLVHYAFSELGLFQLYARVPEYNQAAMRLFRKVGFREEVCERQAAYRDGRRWDLTIFGMVQDEWRFENG